ncbi:hypothetical protein [Labedaea rhizosphaerae]|uniref:Excreted virulence factor EspC (Type VII ESX diderm) n=1 Tax=Labedaea rhizosphaerae TaxID=598644 RepID=A0A4R6S5P4_LABRH|nr:hypothetical protein [Labedaea rhizosphaerae]TDP95060.1 hypothetical protein EV186_105292 [Labedaea rhizosphaerae]
MGDPSNEYAIDADAFRRAIDLWLTPVIDRLKQNNDSYTNAYNTMNSAGSTPGWVSGYGHGDVLSASQSFLNQVGAAIEFLRIDQGQVIDSLSTYRDMALKHIAWAERTDAEHAQNFTNIANNLGQGN